MTRSEVETSKVKGKKNFSLKLSNWIFIHSVNMSINLVSLQAEKEGHNIRAQNSSPIVSKPLCLRGVQNRPFLGINGFIYIYMYINCFFVHAMVYICFCPMIIIMTASLSDDGFCQGTGRNECGIFKMLWFLNLGMIVQTQTDSDKCIQQNLYKCHIRFT